jgi:hypothetical protein
MSRIFTCAGRHAALTGLGSRCDRCNEVAGVVSSSTPRVTDPIIP